MAAGVKESLSKSRQRGQLAHALYFKLDKPAADGSAELLGLDMWCDFKGMMAAYEEHTEAMMPLFKERPAMSVWKQPRIHLICDFQPSGALCDLVRSGEHDLGRRDEAILERVKYGVDA